MKMSNPDVIRLTEIRQFFLDPPYTFKLYSQAAPLFQEANAILEKYPVLQKPISLNLNALYNQLTEQSDNINKVREILKETGKQLSKVNG